MEAELEARETPALLKTPAGYIQLSRWLGIATKNLEPMHKFTTERGLSPSSRTRVRTARLSGTAPEENPFKLLS